MSNINDQTFVRIKKMGKAEKINNFLSQVSVYQNKSIVTETNLHFKFKKKTILGCI